MKCEYCGRVLQPGVYHCPGCGAPVENPVSASETNSINSNGSSRINVSVGGVNISIDGEVANVGASVQNPSPPVSPVPPSAVYVGSKSKGNRKSEYDNVRYAGLFLRLFASLIDVIVCGIIMIFLVVVIPNGDIGMSITLLAWPLYFILCETYWDGMTIGKKGMRIKVVNTSYEKLSLAQGIGRNFGKVISLSFCYIGVIMIPFSKKKRGLHDHIASTYVIRD